MQSEAGRYEWLAYRSVTTQAITAGVMLGVLAVTYALMLLAEHLLRIIGKNGAAILERIMGIILATLSVDLIIDAFVPAWVNGLSQSHNGMRMKNRV